jgi:hypothetical protein
MDATTATPEETPLPFGEGVSPFPGQMTLAFEPAVCPLCGRPWQDMVLMVECIMQRHDCVGS